MKLNARKLRERRSARRMQDDQLRARCAQLGAYYLCWMAPWYVVLKPGRRGFLLGDRQFARSLSAINYIYNYALEPTPRPLAPRSGGAA